MDSLFEIGLRKGNVGRQTFSRNRGVDIHFQSGFGYARSLRQLSDVCLDDLDDISTQDWSSEEPWSPAPYVIETRNTLPFAADLELVAKPKVSLSLMSEVLGEEELTEFYR